MDINIPYPDSGDLQLRIAVGGCRLRIAPGSGNTWVSGTYTDPSSSLPLRISLNGGTARIAHELDGTRIFGWLSGIPTLDLTLGKARAFGLVIETGGSESDIQLGGVPVKRLEIKYGAGKMNLGFAEPNPEPMSLLDIGSGAGSLEVMNLANSNAAEMKLEGGAAAYKFDFGGRLQRDANVRIQTGVSSVEVSVPPTSAARIYPESIIGGISVGDGFTSKDKGFWTSAAVQGGTPVLSIRTTVALGSLRIQAK